MAGEFSTVIGCKRILSSVHSMVNFCYYTRTYAGHSLRYANSSFDVRLAVCGRRWINAAVYAVSPSLHFFFFFSIWVTFSTPVDQTSSLILVMSFNNVRYEAHSTLIFWYNILILSHPFYLISDYVKGWYVA